LAEHLRAYCRDLPDPAPTSIFDHVYVEPTPTLVHQRDELAAYLASFDSAGDGSPGSDTGAEGADR
jgi:pyruvate dehydrogenase E1 component alpha subunit